MNYVILDLEWDNSFFSGGDEKPLNEIIEFGAVKADERFNLIDEFEVLVDPVAIRFVSKRTKKLTKLDMKMLRRNGIPYKAALERFKSFLGDSVLMTWSTSDIIALMDNHDYHYGTNVPDYIHGYINAQEYCQKILDGENTAKQIGLSAAAEMLGIRTDNMELHRALDDSRLALKCLKKLYDTEKLNASVKDASKAEFFERLVFKPFYIRDIHNPLVDKSIMKLNCPQCGRRAVRKTPWEAKSRYFRAEFMCRKCEYEFYGRVKYKMNYDGLEITKSTSPIVKEEVAEPDSEA